MARLSLLLLLFPLAVKAVDSCSALFEQTSTQVPTKYKLSSFVADFEAKKKQVKHPHEMNEIIRNLLVKNKKNLSPDDFTDIALYLVNKATIYKGRFTSRYALSIFNLIRKISLEIDLTEDQASLIRQAMLERPTKEPKKGWSRFFEGEEVLELSELPFGRAGFMPKPNTDYSIKKFKQELSFHWSYMGTADQKNRSMGRLLKKYSKEMSTQDFTSICLWLIRWKLIYQGPFLKLDGKHMIDGFEEIRRATLYVRLDDQQITKIKTAMEKRPGSFYEVLFTFPDSFFGWNQYEGLKKVLSSPFGLSEGFTSDDR